MFILQMTGLSGAGKTTLALALQKALEKQKIPVAIVDADVYRKTLSADLGFSDADRKENMRRLAKVAYSFCQQGRITILAAMNPFEESRTLLREQYRAKTVWIKCSLPTLQQRDVKGLYHKALLPDDHPQKIRNLSGVNAPFENPLFPDLVIDTSMETVTECCQKLLDFVVSLLPAAAHTR